MLMAARPYRPKLEGTAKPMEADEGAIMYSHPEAMFLVISELRSGLATEAEHARRLAAARSTRRARWGRRHNRPAGRRGTGGAR
jgi:hypothetical protein